jgi:hypothetical protein
VLIVELAPGPHRVVVDIKSPGNLFAAPAVVQQQNGVGAARDAMLDAPAAHQSDQFSALR